jgi:hypothetical protein
MNYFKELKTVLLGWSQMRRSCYVEKPAMKNYEEFEACKSRVELDEDRGRFISRPLTRSQDVNALILFAPKKSSKAHSKK